jgi:nucleoid-associated protein YgaU
MQTITISRGNLFDIANRTLGDATLWHTIAAANAISDPWICGLTTLVIPDQENVTGVALVTE